MFRLLCLGSVLLWVSAGSRAGAFGVHSWFMIGGISQTEIVRQFLCLLCLKRKNLSVWIGDTNGVGLPMLFRSAASGVQNGYCVTLPILNVHGLSVPFVCYCIPRFQAVTTKTDSVYPISVSVNPKTGLGGSMPVLSSVYGSFYGLLRHEHSTFQSPAWHEYSTFLSGGSDR